MATVDSLPIPAAIWTRIVAETRLAPREREALELVLRNASDEAIGAALAIARSTVRTYLKRAFQKFDVADRGEFLIVVMRRAFAECGDPDRPS